MNKTFKILNYLEIITGSYINENLKKPKAYVILGENLIPILKIENVYEIDALRFDAEERTIGGYPFYVSNIPNDCRVCIIDREEIVNLED